MRQSLVQLGQEDGHIISDAIARQERDQHVFPLDAADRRHIDIANRTVVRTEQGEVEVEVPERDERQPMSDATAPEVRSSLKTQAKVAHLGAVLGFNIWVPASDRAKIIELVPANSQERFVTSLPLNYDLTTLKTIENIDVIWLLRRSIVHAFEVEHTTAIYSGLLRMADLLALQPRMVFNFTLLLQASDASKCAARLCVRSSPSWRVVPWRTVARSSRTRLLTRYWRSRTLHTCERASWRTTKSFSTLEEIQEIVLTVNLTPRKCLGFKTPFQVILKELGKDVQIRFS